MNHAKLQSLPLAAARWTTGFWADRFAVCRDVMVPSMGRLTQRSQRIRFLGNFEVAAGQIKGEHRGAKWNDGDFYKWIEAASTVLAFSRDADLEKQLDEIISLIAAAQAPDGYIHTDVQIHGKPRFGNPMDFEMYNMGHLITAAIVHHRATGKKNLLQIARKAADYLDSHFAEPTPSVARHGICPAHLMALVDLYRLTNHQPYLDLAVRLLNMRDLVKDGDDDNQDRIPFRQQRQAIGHAVRATYLYAGAADIFAETAEPALMETLQSCWSDLMAGKIQITGGCGALFDGASPDGVAEQETIRRVHQSFGRDFQLPQSTAHNETCAAIGNLLWNWRMLLITGESRFAEVVEQSFFNSVLAGIDLEGVRFFYTNTLRNLRPMPTPLRWSRRREELPECFCCPPNVLRTIAQAVGYSYAVSGRDVWAILYGSSKLQTDWIALSQETDYPWDGRIRITIAKAPAEPIALHLRIPAWADDATIKINGRDSVIAKPGTFHALLRKWSVGDVVELNLPMPVRKIEANPLVEELRGQLAVARGPIVYCLESVDLPAGVRLLDVSLGRDAELTPTTDSALPGLTVLRGRAVATDSAAWSGELFRDISSRSSRPIDIRLIPYFAWDNRGESEMTVWIPLES